MRFQAILNGFLVAVLTAVGSFNASAQQLPVADQNLTNCLGGYGLCDRSKIAPQDAPSVEQAAYKRNLANCLGGYGLCDRSKIAQQDAPSVEQAAYKRNLANCLGGYGLCDRSKIASNDMSSVDEAILRSSIQHPGTTTLPRITTERPLDGYGVISRITGRSKTIAVSGYIRRNGTYVRPHYRSRR